MIDGIEVFKATKRDKFIHFAKKRIWNFFMVEQGTPLHWVLCTIFILVMALNTIMIPFLLGSMDVQMFGNAISSTITVITFFGITIWEGNVVIGLFYTFTDFVMVLIGYLGVSMVAAVLNNQEKDRKENL